MKAIKNASSGVWHLVGSRGCGAEPDGEVVEENWAVIRDTVERDAGTRCSTCRWPTG